MTPWEGKKEIRKGVHSREDSILTGSYIITTEIASLWDVCVDWSVSLYILTSLYPLNFYQWLGDDCNSRKCGLLSEKELWWPPCHRPTTKYKVQVCEGQLT